MGKQFEFCRVCRQNHNQGRGHRYSNKHKQCLERLQEKMLQKVQEIRRCVESLLPVTNAVLAPYRHKFWCDFCEQEIVEKVRSSSSFAGAEAVKHLAGSNHVQNVKSFWKKNGGDFEKQSMYIIEGTDQARWEERCQVALRASLGMDDQQLSSSGNDIIIPPEEGSTMASLSRVGLQRPVVGLPHAQVLSFEEAGEGNVHSGAAPPWLKKYVDEGDSLVTGGVASSLSDLLPLSRAQQAKLLKIRNPNRVGAAWADRRRVELALEQGGEIFSREAENISSWFPSFGRVWQSGPRRDTRKDFEAERKHSLKSQMARGERGVVKTNAKSSRGFEFKPYVSRRQTTDGV